MEERKVIKTAQIEDQGAEVQLDLNAPLKVHFHNFGKEGFREQFMEDYFHCCLCGDELEFTHVAHFVHQEVREDACCPSCRVRTRTATHKLQ